MSGQSRPSVLVVDDDPRALKLMRIVLEHAGYRVATVTNGESACALLASEPHDVLISDLQMPGMNGIELCAWTQRTFDGRGPLMLLLTAQDDAATRRAAAEAGIAEIVTKPFDRLGLLDRLSSLLRPAEGE